MSADGWHRGVHDATTYTYLHKYSQDLTTLTSKGLRGKIATHSFPTSLLVRHVHLNWTRHIGKGVRRVRMNTTVDEQHPD